MIVIDAASAVPAYEQIRSQVAARVHDGTLRPGAALPTVRRLAADLGLATNTVARAYRELEAEGLLRTAGRRGTTVADAPLTPAARAQAAALVYLETTGRLGIPRAEALRIVSALARD